MRPVVNAMCKQMARACCGALVVVLAACSSVPEQPVAVEERSPVPKTVLKPSAVVAPNPADGPVHVVQKGETLSRIAVQYKLTVADLTAWNSLADPNKVEVDQRLRLTPPPDANGVVVKPISTDAPPEGRPLNGSPAPVAAPVVAAPRAQEGKSLVKQEPIAGVVPYSDSALAKARVALGITTPINPSQTPGQGGTKAASNSATPATSVAAAPAAVSPTPAAATPPKVVAAAASGQWAWPAEGQVVRPFDGKGSKGIDIAVAPGGVVLAASAGKVVYAGDNLPGYGLGVIIKHDNQYLSVYGKNGKLLVKEGQMVNQGQKIAEMPKSSPDPLHFEIRSDSKPVNPKNYLPNRE